MTPELSAELFASRLYELQSEEERSKITRYFKTDEGDYGHGDEFIGVRMGDVFKLAKEFVDMPVPQIEHLMESPIHEVRSGAMSIMDKSARKKSIPDERREALHDLYLRRIDRINNWDLVDLAAPYVVGGYLYERDRTILYDLARSENLWERRTAIVATAYFIRQGDIGDTYRIAEMLIDDDQDLIHKAAGGWVREAGKKDRARLLAFLDQHAARMPRTFLRYAMEHLEQEQKEHYRALRKEEPRA